MSKNFRIAILCVILAVFAFVLLGIFRGFEFTIPSLFWYLLPGLVSLISIAGLIKKKIWAKWTGLSICSFILLMSISYNLRYFLFYRTDSMQTQKQIFGTFGGRNEMIHWLLSPMFCIPLLGIIGIVLALNIRKKS